jgi:hypothetical protein
MATNYPTSLQDLDATRGTNTDPLSAPNHVTHHTLEDDTIEAIQTKLGIDGSADTNSIDYKLKSTSSSNPGHKHTLVNGATDVGATAAELTYMSSVTGNVQSQFSILSSNKVDKGTLTTKGDIFVATAGSVIARLGVGTNGDVLTADSSISSGLKWASPGTTQLKSSFTAGETINGATTPVPVYFDNSSDKIFACDANVLTKLEFIGFANTNSTDGNAIDVVYAGKVSGFSSLTIGEKYYVQDSVGTIGTTIGTAEIYVGTAVSSTEILIDNNTKNYPQYISQQAISTNNNTINSSIVSVWRVCNINASGNFGACQGDVVIYKTGKRTGTNTTATGGSPFIAGWDVTFDGSSLITMGVQGGTSSVNGTAYFYR